VSDWPEPLARAYAVCDAMARSHYENFPVASRLLPRAMRPHVAAVYAYARVADDIADEGTAPAAERQEKLSAWRQRLHRAAEDGTTAAPATARDDLILSAFGQDTMTKRYASWHEVLDYCRRSANPVGRLVLRIAGYRDEGLDRSSDALCTALQLTNFWQDFGRDWRAGRLYVPREVHQACGATEGELASGRITPAWAEALQRCAEYTRSLFAAGRLVCGGVRGRLGFELRFTWLGGSRVLERVEEGRSRLFEYRPTLGFADAPLLLWRAARWKRAAS
jgi:squalene synthase HpnC